MTVYRITDPDGARALDLDGDAVTFGRSRRCTVRIRDGALSRVHCEVLRRPDGHWLRDLDSRNGTLLNGLPAHDALLRPGDRIGIGRTVIVYDPLPAPPSPPPAPAAPSPASGAPPPSRRRTLAWTLAGFAAALAVGLVAWLYCLDERAELVLGGIRLRRGTTTELNRRVLGALALVAALHAVYLLIALAGRRRAQRGNGEKDRPGSPPDAGTPSV